jgi:hypothetical protein
VNRFRASHLRYNAIIINYLRKVTARQPLAESHSTPHEASASIAVMKSSPNLGSTESATPNPAIHESRSCAHSLKAGKPARHKERGAGKLKAILWTLALAIFIYVSFKVLPALINEFEFQDGIQTIARFASATRQAPELMRVDILKEAQKDSVPVETQDIKIEAVNGNIKISVEYSVTVDLTFYQWTLNFHPTASNSSLT